MLFKHNLGAFQRVYAFLSQIFDYGNTAIEKRAILFKRLLPLLKFGREREGVDLFEGEPTDDDKLIDVNHALKGKLLESDILVQQVNNKEQFAHSPDLANGLMNAIMDALSAHSSLSRQALGSEKARSGLKDVLPDPAQLYEASRERPAARESSRFPMQ